MILSVILPAYQAEETIEEAIASILAQTFTEFELIIIEDGSQDLTIEKIKMFNDQRIVLIEHQKNQGLIFSLNEGIQQANGEYIARMDADDIAHPCRFEKQLEFLAQNSEIGIVGSDAIFFNHHFKRKQIMPRSHQKLRAMALFYTPFIHPSVMMRREVLKKRGYSDQFPSMEDYALWVELLSCTKGATLPKTLLSYRVLKDSITRTSEKNQRKRYELHQMILVNYLKTLSIVFTPREYELLALLYSKHYSAMMLLKKSDCQQLYDTLKKLRKILLTKSEISHREVKKVIALRWGIFLTTQPWGRFHFTCLSLAGVSALFQEWIFKKVLKRKKYC